MNWRPRASSAKSAWPNPSCAAAPRAWAEAAGQLRATELERARAVWQKKFGAPAADTAARARQARFLAARGFAADVVRRVLNAWPDADESSSDFNE